MTYDALDRLTLHLTYPPDAAGRSCCRPPASRLYACAGLAKVDPFPSKGSPMRLRPAALLAPLVLLPALASPPLAAAALTIPPLQYPQRTLPNGLQVTR